MNGNLTDSENKVSGNVKKIVLFGALSFLLLGIITGIPTVIWGHQALLNKNRILYSEVDRRIIIGGMILGYLGIALSTYIIFLLLAAYFGWNIKDFLVIITG
ncbi:MAG: hypothetical protein JRG74_08055 [Deltaproteobacteria bacterium]|nr:hypothetical protein [Deltaproteobacteria bacterium]